MKKAFILSILLLLGVYENALAACYSRQCSDGSPLYYVYVPRTQSINKPKKFKFVKDFRCEEHNAKGYDSWKRVPNKECTGPITNTISPSVNEEAGTEKMEKAEKMEKEGTTALSSSNSEAPMLDTKVQTTKVKQKK